MAIAPLLAGWSQRNGRLALPPVLPSGIGSGPSLPYGVNILQDEFPPVGNPLTLIVEAAWGASVSTNSSTWTWTDITPDVLMDAKVDITIGRPDESNTPQPAQAAFVLDNTSGNYTYGARSANYPNVRKNVPIRVSVIYGGARSIRFFGYSTGFEPGWDSTGNFAIATVTAAGWKRRLTQANAPAQSALDWEVPRTGLGVTAWWPLEDNPGASGGAAAIGTQGPMAISNAGSGVGTAAFGATADFLGATQEVTLSNGALLTGNGAPLAPMDTIPSSDTGWTVLFGMKGAGTVYINQNQGVNTSFMLELQVNSDTSFNLIMTPNGGAPVTEIPAPAGYLNANGWNWIGISVENYGTRPGDQITYFTVSTNQFATSTIDTSCTPSALNSITFTSPSGGSISYSQCFVIPLAWIFLFLESDITGSNASGYNGPWAYLGYSGEDVASRMARLASAQGEIAIPITGDATLQLVGPQTPGTYLNTQEALAVIDGGILYDGVSQGLSYVSLDGLTSQAASLVLDASLSQVEHPIMPVDDDQLTVNSYIATRTSGSFSVWNDTTSPLSVGSIGEHPKSASEDFYADGEQLTDFASWQVNVGTVNDYRWTPVMLWLHHHPELLTSWLATGIGSRIDLTNVSKVRSQMSPAPAHCLVQGWSEIIDQFTWIVTVNTSPYAPWSVAETAQTTGDTNPFILRSDTDGSTLTAPVAVGATSCTVNTPSGPLWTTVADDFPVQLSIGGWPVSVTNITGAGSTQTMTLDPTTVVAPIAAGAAVTLFYYNVLAR